MSATSPGVVDATRLLPAIEAVLAAATPQEDDAFVAVAEPTVAMVGELITAGGYDFGVIATVRGLNLPHAIVDLRPFRAIIERTWAYSRADLLDVWTTPTHLRLASADTTWSLPLRPPATDLAELAPAGTDPRLLLAGDVVPQLIAPAQLIDRSQPHTVPVLETVHVLSRAGLVVAETAPGPIAVASTLPVMTLGDDLLDMVIPLRLVDVLDAVSSIASVTLTNSHALVGAGRRRALIVDVEELLAGVKITAWALTPDGRYPDLRPRIHPTGEPTWVHDTTRAALARALADINATAVHGTHVAVADDHTTDGLIDLVTSDGATRASLGTGTVGDPRVWVPLRHLAQAVRPLPAGPVRLSGSGMYQPLLLTAGPVRAAIQASTPPGPPQPID